MTGKNPDARAAYEHRKATRRPDGVRFSQTMSALVAAAHPERRRRMLDFLHASHAPTGTISARPLAPLPLLMPTYLLDTGISGRDHGGWAALPIGGPAVVGKDPDAAGAEQGARGLDGERVRAAIALTDAFDDWRISGGEATGEAADKLAAALDSLGPAGMRVARGYNNAAYKLNCPHLQPNPAAGFSLGMVVDKRVSELVPVVDPDRWDDCSQSFEDTHWLAPHVPADVLEGNGKLYEQMLVSPAGNIPGASLFRFRTALDMQMDLTDAVGNVGGRIDIAFQRVSHPAGDGRILINHGCAVVREFQALGGTWYSHIRMRKQLRFHSWLFNMIPDFILQAALYLEMARAIDVCAL